ncbi:MULTISPECIES: hypothetical protein [Mycobacteroides]|nr:MULTISPECIES: hypothetical protein [Mycobacteroides]AMT69284.1 hypothetical protein ABG82_01885 [Mycobacteroides immunogenum]KPG02334.1 hypothetical protein AN909_27620 [Mycobacteroides immunogenum]KPG02398.1 hypothetical protein AN910_27660 [Mycobacteroides immunogenum]KPG20281.1 hypothetical protein AN912_30185 [Mycobacteroides immunogenum]KPG36149.1 hypothetical protein AN915_28850 [Mycobacteroides immunogenum]
MTTHQLIDGRITSRADRLAPERCQRCGYRGASLAPNANGRLTCSLCDPTGWDVPLAPKRGGAALILAVGPDAWFRPFNIERLIERAEHEARLRGGERAVEELRAEVTRLRDELDVRIAAQRGTWPAFQRQIVREVIEEALNNGDVTPHE